jgi:2,4-didehydro-3-deoxy-L-rhamnonate hydrolase
MRVANSGGRLVIVTGDAGHEIAYDVEKSSGGRFRADPQAVYDEWDAFTAWAATAQWQDGEPCRPEDLGSPAPAPRQVFGIGLNYREHVAESGYDVPVGQPPVFTKFPSCITGPRGEIEMPPGGHVDWEVELVAVIGRRAYRVPVDRALEHVAGYAVGQDISERVLQLAAQPPQFSLGKSLPGFGPIGPWLVTLDEVAGVADPNDLELGCEVNGEPVQLSRTSQLIFSVPALIANLSASTPLLPGDVIFTGTPSGVGLGRSPQRWLAHGDILTSHIESIGGMRHRFVVAEHRKERT